MNGTLRVRNLAAALCIAASLGGANVTRADDLEGGLAAFGRTDYATALHLWTPLANQGNAAAQNYLGLMYFSGQGVPQNYAAAWRWFNASARQGYIDGENNLGGLYYFGFGVAQDYVEAFHWYHLSAEQGNAPAETALGDMYRDGRGTAQSYEDAFRWFERAARQGESGGQNNLGVMYHEGWGVIRNDAEALKWFELSAKQGNPVGQYDLTTFRKITSDVDENVNAIPLEEEGGAFVVPALLNSSIKLNFVVDSGSADVSVPADVFLTLMRTGTIKDTDLLDRRTYQLADGSKVQSRTFRIRTLRVGTQEIDNVTASISSVKGSLLLGQSFLTHFKSWSIDNQRHVLVLEPDGIASSQ